MPTVMIQKDTEGQKALPVFQELAKRMDAVRQRAFHLFERRGSEPGHDLEDWVTAEHEVLGLPPAELKEKAEVFEMQVTLPGFAPNDIEITATADQIIVHAANEQMNEGEEGQVLWSEIGAHDVYRRFDLPQGIDTDAATARLDDGILRITVPKAKLTEAKQIPISAG